MPNILRGAGEYVFEEKRSKFIGQCEPAQTEAETRAVIERVRAAYKTATHHVYAYIVSPERDVVSTIRHNDDGEPQGTAGLPVLQIFQKQDITDFVCVVTRYFGGTLLGAGGLVRAYARAAKGALEAAGFERRIRTAVYTVACPYARLAQMKYFFSQNGIVVSHVDYGAHCEASVIVPESAELVFHAEGLYTIL